MRALLCLVAAAASLYVCAASTASADVIVYGSTPGGVMSAVAAARADANLSVLLLDPAQRLGGMCSGGLGKTDSGITFAIGGLANEFFTRNARVYNASAQEALYLLEPHVAESIFYTMLNVSNLQVVRVPQGLSAVTVSGGKIVSVTDAATGTVYTAGVFIDGTYEGDLLYAAGASMTYGREPNTTYGESYAGRREPYSAMDYAAVSPFDPDTGALMPLATDAYAAALGSGDDKVMDYNFRLCVTKDAANKLPWTQPPNYNASYWSLLRAYAKVAPPVLGSYLNNIQPVPNGKYDMNNGGLISTDAAGLSWGWPNGTAAQRAALWQAHYEYQAGFLWFLVSDPAVPAAVQSAVKEFGLCADEFQSNTVQPGWPEQLYVREGRRLVGDVIFTQKDVLNRTNYSTASIGLGSYAFDGHYSHRGPCLPVRDGSGKAIGCTMWTSSAPPPTGTDVWTGGEGYPGPNTDLYQIPYTVLLPKRAELTNVLAVTTPSASHVAFCTIRMEPQFMVLGHAAGDAAALALKHGVAVQDVPLSELHAQLAAEGAVLCHQGYPDCK